MLIKDSACNSEVIMWSLIVAPRFLIACSTLPISANGLANGNETHRINAGETVLRIEKQSLKQEVYSEGLPSCSQLSP